MWKQINQFYKGLTNASNLISLTAQPLLMNTTLLVYFFSEY